MSNAEKVSTIIGRAKTMLPMMKSQLGDSVDGYEEYFKKSLLNMAEWKDQQFKEYLEKKKAEIPLSYRSDWKSYVNANYRGIINEIIEGFFKEEQE